MRNLRLALTLALVISAVLVGTVTLVHAHDASAAGLYSSQCPLNEAAGHIGIPPLSALSGADLDVTAFPVASTIDVPPLGVVSNPAAPRAPPSS